MSFNFGTNKKFMWIEVSPLRSAPIKRQSVAAAASRWVYWISIVTYKPNVSRIPFNILRLPLTFGVGRPLVYWTDNKSGWKRQKPNFELGTTVSFETFCNFTFNRFQCNTSMFKWNLSEIWGFFLPQSYSSLDRIDRQGQQSVQVGQRKRYQFLRQLGFIATESYCRSADQSKLFLFFFVVHKI